MSYASSLGAAPAATPIKVGALAAKDPVLAKASLIAAKILQQAVGKSMTDREEFVAAKLNAMRPGAAKEALDERRRQQARGVPRDQAIFDGIRLAIANALADDIITTYRFAVAQERGVDALGDDTARDVGCAVTGGVGIVAGIIGSIYGGQAGGTAAGAGTQVLGSALDCNRREREAQLEIARQNSAAAQAAANAAQAQALAQVQLEQARGQTITKVLLIGGGVVILGGIAFMALK